MTGPFQLLTISGMCKASSIAAVLLLIGLVAAETKTSTLNFLVLKESNGKPVRNAAVVLHEVDKNGKQGKGGFELKTNQDGKTFFDGVPYGQLRIQVLAPGFQTFGDDYQITQPVQEIIIKLKPPQKQYSIYK